jgi:hypothetical protein
VHSSGSKREVQLDLLISHETDAAVLVSNGIIEVWLPKSQISIEYSRVGGLNAITMPEWLAIDKELI